MSEWVSIKISLPNKANKYLVTTKPRAGHYRIAVEKAYFGEDENGNKIFWQGK